MRNEIREQLTDVESRLRSLRDERSRTVKVADAAKAAARESDSDASLDAVKAAVDATRSVEAKIEEVQAEQIGLLRRIGDAEAGRAGFAYGGVDGWKLAANELDLHKQLRVEVGAPSLLRPQAAVPLAPTQRDGSVPVLTARESNRYLYPALAHVPFGSGPGDLAATDFTVSFSQAELTGVERDPVATTQKATLSPDVGLATVEARQHAVVLDDIPSKLFDSQDALRALLGVEMARQVDESIDRHVVSAIEAAAPPAGLTGANLVAQIRNAITEMSELGGRPTVLALTPSDAAALDLTQDGAGQYVFTLRLAGSGSPVWSLFVREVPGIAEPTLIDPDALGVLYLGDASVLVDPYTGLSTNQVRARVEIEATCHIRNVAQGAFVIA